MSKVKSSSNYDIALLHPLTNVPTKYHHPVPCSFCDKARQNESHDGKVKGQIKVKLRRWSLTSPYEYSHQTCT